MRRVRQLTLTTHDMRGAVTEKPLEYCARRSLYRDSLLSFLGAQCDLYLLTEMRGNIGDHLIWAGTRDLLKSARVRYRPIPLHEVGDEDHPRSTLLVPGSGALTKSWHEWLPSTVIKASNSFDKVIILPSSFDLRVPIVAQCLSQPNVYGFARETTSYRSAKVLGRAALSLDCAIYLHRFHDGAARTSRPGEGSSLLLTLRDDKDSLLPGQGFAPNPDMNEDISLAMVNLDDWIDAIAQAATVVTDRLHVAVASVLLGKRLVYLDPDCDKISTYFKYTFRDTFNDLVRRCSIAWLLAHEFVVASEAT